MSTITQANPKTIAPGALVPNPGNYCGITVRETAGAAATVRLWDNASAASGTLVATIALAANGSLNTHPGGGSVYFAKGLFVEVVAGTVEGSVYVG